VPWHLLVISLSLSLSLSNQCVCLWRTLFTGQRERGGERERERKSRECGHALSVPHSVSQSACVIIVIVNVCRVVRMMPQLEVSLTIVILTAPEVPFLLLEL
jgi:hypothetical protein